MKPRDVLKALAAQVLCATGVARLARRRLHGQLAILMFHGVEAQPLSPPCPYVLDAPTLRRELKFVSLHFTVLPLDEALERLSNGTLPARAATLTFDDGTRNLAVHAAPILRELGLPAAVFLATGPMGTSETLWPDRLWLAFARTRVGDIDLAAFGLEEKHSLRDAAGRTEAWLAVIRHLKTVSDTERIDWVESITDALGAEADATPGPFELLSWDEARAMMHDARVSLHPHTVTHPILSRCTDEKVDAEISESCMTLERETGQSPSIFAYPNGQVSDFDHRAKEVLRRNGIRWALSTTSGFADRNSDPLELPRIGIGGDGSYAQFRLRVSGALPLRRLRALATSDHPPC